MDKWLHLIKLAQQGDKEARDVLIEENLGLVHHVIKRFKDRGCDMEDLFQIGTIGLMKAVDKFDVTFAVAFSTYAVPMIMGEIKRFLRDDGMVKVSRTLKENGYKIKQAKERFVHDNGREPDLHELSEITEIAVEDIVMALEANVAVESIYKSVYQSDGSEVCLADQLVDGGNRGVAVSAVGSRVKGELCGNTMDAEKEKLLDHIVLKQLLDELDDRERELITLRYFGDKTQTQVAEKFGVSQVQISRIEKKILIRMRERINS